MKINADILLKACRSRFTHHSTRITLTALALGSPILASTKAAAPIDESKLPPPASITVDFQRDIKPLLADHCYKCHAGEKPKGHLLLTSRETALKGGGEGVDILPGQSAKSPLIHYVARLVPDMEMPPEGKGTPLTPEQVGLLRAWIDQGVVWEHVEPESSTRTVVSPVVGGIAVHGDKAKFREHYWQLDGWNGGLEDFELHQKLAADAKLSLTSRILRDDYKVELTAEKNDLGFTHFGWSQYRKYYDRTGGYDPLFTPASYELTSDLHKDIGRAWVDFGLTLPNLPRFVLGYEYQYRDGSESTLQWGSVHDGTETRNLFPAEKTVSEKVHILKFDVDYDAAGWLLTDNFRAEWYDLSSTRWNEAYSTAGTSGTAYTLVNEKQTHFQGANTAHLEKQFTGWLFGSGGYLYSRFSGDSLLNSTNVDANYLSASLAIPQWQQTLPTTLDRESHVFSVAGLLGPWEGLTLSLGSQNEWTRQEGFGSATGQLALPFAPYYFKFSDETNFSDLDRETFSQNASLRFTKIPFTTVYAEGRLRQESIGQYQEELGGLTQFMCNTDAKSHLNEFRAGFNTSPWRRVSLSGYFRRSDEVSDYDNFLKQNTSGQTFAGYPSYIRWRDLLTDEAEAKLSLQLATWVKTSLSYKWLGDDYKTETDSVDSRSSTGSTISGGISPGGSLLAGRYDAHIASVNATVTPWRRLFLSATFSYQNARTTTFSNGDSSVAPYAGNTYSVIASSTFVVDDKTDLSLSYSGSLADFSQDNASTALPLGLNYSMHNVSVSISRKLSRYLSGSLRYAYFGYTEPSSGNVNDYTAHGVFAMMTYRWP